MIMWFKSSLLSSRTNLDKNHHFIWQIQFLNLGGSFNLRSRFFQDSGIIRIGLLSPFWAEWCDLFINTSALPLSTAFFSFKDNGPSDYFSLKLHKFKTKMWLQCLTSCAYIWNTHFSNGERGRGLGVVEGLSWEGRFMFCGNLTEVLFPGLPQLHESGRRSEAQSKTWWILFGSARHKQYKQMPENKQMTQHLRSSI